MGFFDISEKILNEAFTENKDKAYYTTGSACLDYFSIVGGMRYNIVDALNLFMKAYYEDQKLAIKLLFFVRDIKEGLGERSIFRYTLNALACMYPNVCKQLIKYIPIYGRYDDLLVALNTPIHQDVINFIKEQLDKDIEAKKNNQAISLLAKWLPSINTSSLEARNYAKVICSGLGLKQEEYRKILSSLRKGLIIENNLREKDYSFVYKNVPGNALLKYHHAFINNDNERYNEYLVSVKQGKSKINTNVLYPYEIIRKFEGGTTLEERDFLNTVWENFDRRNISSKTIVVRDGSGSMYDFNPVSAACVATSLAILFAEQLTGDFKDKFITFSSHPKLVKLNGKTVYDKYEELRKYDDISNTDIAKVYKLIYDVYCNKSFKEEDAIDRIVIISDMEFDYGVDINQSTFETIKSNFKEKGFKLPEVVFWNVRSRNVHFPTTNEMGVKLISGSSAKVISMITNNSSIDPYNFMLECLEKYSCFDDVVIE